MRILERFKSFSSHSVTRNASALVVMQFANYALPLLVLPFLTRKLGIDAFGAVAVTLAAIQLAYTLTDYGFSLSATYAISINRNDLDYINRKIGAIFGAKLVLITLASLAFLSVSSIFPQLSLEDGFFTAVLLAVIAQAFQPIWLFQGLERMRSITVYSVITKIFYAGLVVCLINSPSDAVLVVYCWGGAQVTGLIAALYFMRKEGFTPYLPSVKLIKYEFKEGAQFFWSRLAVSVYSSASTLVVGASSVSQAAFFAVTTQIYKAGQNATSPINSAMYPYMATHKDWKVFYRVLVVTGTILILGCFIVGSVAGPLLETLFGEGYSEAKPILIVFLCTTVINYFAVTFGYSAFSALGRIGVANITVMVGALFHVSVLFIQYCFFEINAINVAIATLATELFVMCSRVALFFYFKSKC